MNDFASTASMRLQLLNPKPLHRNLHTQNQNIGDLRSRISRGFVMLVCLQATRRMATIANISKLIVTSGALQSRASAASIHTRALVSVHSSSAFLDCRVGSFGAQRLQSFCGSQSRSKRMTTSATSEPQVENRQYFALTYDYVPDILERRGPHRPGHLALAQAEVGEGKLLLGGAWGDPVDGALFIWLVNSADEIQQFVDKDPYVAAGLVTKFDIRPVAAAVGTWVTAAKK